MSFCIFNSYRAKVYCIEHNLCGTGKFGQTWDDWTARCCWGEGKKKSSLVWCEDGLVILILFMLFALNIFSS